VAGQGRGCGACVRVHWYTMSEQSGPASLAATSAAFFSLSSRSFSTIMVLCRSNVFTLYWGLTLVHFSAQRKHFLWDTLGSADLSGKRKLRLC